MGKNEERRRSSQGNFRKEENTGFTEYIRKLINEGIKFGFSFESLYKLNLQELEILIIESRKGLGYKIWRIASLLKHPFITNFPETAEEACPELFPEKTTVIMPDWLYEKYMKRGGK